METGGPTNANGLGGGPVMDVRPPGAVAANPSSKPVITNQPLQADPMMTPRPNPLPNHLNTSLPAESAPLETPAAPTTRDSQVASSAMPNTPSVMPNPAANTIQTQAEPLHKLSHDEPFFGHVPHRRGNKLLIVILVLVLLGGAAGAYLWWRHNKTTPAATARPQTATPKVEEKKVSTTSESVASIATPEGYLTFSSSDLGYSFAFPGEFKEIKQELTAAQSDNKSVIYRSTGQPSLNGYTGQLMITQYTDANSNIAVGMGELIALKGGKWVYDAASGSKKVGDAYIDSSGKQPSAVKAGGLEVYTFTTAKEDSTIVQLLFVAKNKLNVIELPVAFTTVVDKEQKTLKNNILGTLKQL